MDSEDRATVLSKKLRPSVLTAAHKANGLIRSATNLTMQRPILQFAKRQSSVMQAPWTSCKERTVVPWLFTRGWERAIGIALVKGVQCKKGVARDCKKVPKTKAGKHMLLSTS